MRKITNTDLNGRGVLGQPDAPGLTASEMQRKVEEVAREVIIPIFNEDMSAYEADKAANELTVEEIRQVSSAADSKAQNALASLDEARREAVLANQNSQIAADTAAEAKQTAQSAYTLADSLAILFDPASGQRLPVQQVINNLYNLVKTEPITAGEFAALNITVAAFNAKRITVAGFNTRAKQILTV